MHAATLHLLTLLATVAFDAAHCFVLPNKQLVFDSRPLPSGSNEGHWNGGDIVASRVSDGLNDMPPQLQQEMGNTFKSADRSVYDPGVGFEGDQQGNANAVGVGAPGDETADAENDAIADGAELLRQLHERITQDEEIAVKSALLLKLLESGDAFTPMPLVYVEDEPDEAPIPILDESAADMPGKRSGRYNRRYPYKRQNTRYRTYESEQRYLCNPSRNDVLKLLIGLDEGRKGNHGRTVNFCNRKRPAKAIFSNIRFLG